LQLIVIVIQLLPLENVIVNIDFKFLQGNGVSPMDQLTITDVLQGDHFLFHMVNGIFRNQSTAVSVAVLCGLQLFSVAGLRIHRLFVNLVALVVVKNFGHLPGLRINILGEDVAVIIAQGVGVGKITVMDGGVDQGNGAVIARKIAVNDAVLITQVVEFIFSGRKGLGVVDIVTL